MSDEKTVHTALARAVANRKIPDNVIKKLASQIAENGEIIRRLDVCSHGICLDYFIDAKDLWRVLPKIITVGGGRVYGIEIFPWGIINPDLFHVHIEHSFDSMVDG